MDFWTVLFWFGAVALSLTDTERCLQGPEREVGRGRRMLMTQGDAQGERSKPGGPGLWPSWKPKPVSVNPRVPDSFVPLGLLGPGR